MKCGRNEIMITIIIVLFLSLGIGYAYLSTELKLDTKVTVKKTTCDNISDLYQRINCKAKLDNIESEYVTSSTGINFSQASSETNGKGIYKRAGTENDEFPINYYRGQVTDNNVNFANMCWKIVRTTSTGGIKLVYNGIPQPDGRCENTDIYSQLEIKKAFNENYSSPADVGYMYGTRYIPITKDLTSQTNDIIYANDVKFNATTGEYLLQDTITSSSWENDRSNLAQKYHYTCFSGNDHCNRVNYILFFGSPMEAYYIELIDGDNLESAKEKMFTNTTDSTIKKAIDEWYRENMTDYTIDYLEDTIWCNDRSIDYGSLKSKDTDAKTDNSYFGSFVKNVENPNPNFACPNITDSFTVDSNKGNGKLSYPTGLLTADEVTLAGYNWQENNNDSYLSTGQHFWTMSPFYFDSTNAVNFYLYSSGRLNLEYVGSQNGIRPAISLRNGTSIHSGDGTPNSPFTLSKPEEK